MRAITQYIGDNAKSFQNQYGNISSASVGAIQRGLLSLEQKAHLNTLMAEMAALKENFRRERWIEVDMAWHEHIYEMSANPFLTSFASLFHSVYHTYFTSITSDTVIKLDLHQAIVDAIIQSDGDAAFKACQALLRSPDK